MKNKFFRALVASAALLSAISCLKEDENNDYIYSAILTARQEADGSMFFSMGTDRAFIPINPELEKYKYTDRDEKRVLAYFSIPEEPNKTPSHKEGFTETYKINVSQIDTIYIAPTVVSTGNKDTDAEKYGSAFMDIVDSGYNPGLSTSDGYLNVFYRLYFGTIAKHNLTLVIGENPAEPYTVHLRHSNGGDNVTANYGDGLACFSLRDLPDTGGETVGLKVVWDGYYGETHEKRIEYCTRKN